MEEIRELERKAAIELRQQLESGQVKGMTAAEPEG